MKIPIKKIRARAEIDFEKTWLDSTQYLEMEGNLFNLTPNGDAHPLKEFMEDARKSLLKLGFNELILPLFVDEREIYKQYGPEAPVILDRLYFLAGLPRPDIGISAEKIEGIQKIVPEFSDVEGLKKIFRAYKKGTIEADDLIETLVLDLKMKEEQASLIIDKIFPEFKDLTPIPTTTTLRSHTTALWFPVLAELKRKTPLPLQYFIIGPKFRREQKQDSTHLFVSNTLSIALLAEKISLEDGKRIGREIAKAIGFDQVKVETKVATSKYYAPQTEFEIFVQHPVTKEWLEIGDGGFYSPIALANYEIEYPVLNIGFGVERIVMIQTEEKDIRKLVYPYFYSDLDFTDGEIAGKLSYDDIPRAKELLEIGSKVQQIAWENRDKTAPVDILAWKGVFNNSQIKITLYEHDTDAQLLGAGARNSIWVKDGQIKAAGEGSTLEGGINTELTVLEGLILQALKTLETQLPASENKTLDIRTRWVKRPAEINLHVPDLLQNYFDSKKKGIKIQGPVFLGIKIEINPRAE